MATVLDQVLKLFITADGRGLSAGLQKSLGEIKNFSGSAQRAFSGVQTAFAALGVTIGTGAFIAGIKKTIDGFDQLNDASKRLGVTTESLSALGYAAEQSGSSLEGIQTGLRFLNRNLIDAQEGSKDLATTFRQLGVAVTDDTETALLKIADAFARLPDGAQKTAAAIKLFGRSGAELIPLLNEGSAGIAKFRAEAERLGIIVSKQSAQAADEFNDSLNTLSKSISSVGISIANQALPSLNKLATSLSDVAKNGGSALDVLGRLAIEIERAFRFGIGESGLTKELDDQQSRLKEAEDAIARYKRIRDGLEEESFGSSLRRLATGQSVVEQIEAWGDRAAAARSRIAEINGELTRLQGSGSAKAIAGQVAAIDAAARDAAESVVKLQTSYKKLIEDLKQGRAESERAAFKGVEKSSVLDINRLKDQAQAALERGGETGAEEAKRFLDQAKKINDYLLETGQISKTYYQTQADALTKFAEQGQLLLESAGLQLPVGIDEEASAAAQAAYLEQSRAFWAQNPAYQPVIPQVQYDLTNASVPTTPHGVNTFAGGGQVSGPGTSLSDSILARLSAGEFVVRAQAVKSYGLGFLERLNSMALPRFATGGMVSTGTPVNLYLPGGQSFPMTAQPSVAKQLASILSTEVLKRGRR